MVNQFIFALENQCGIVVIVGQYVFGHSYRSRFPYITVLFFYLASLKRKRGGLRNRSSLRPHRYPGDVGDTPTVPL